jgi:hypothetical protein
VERGGEGREEEEGEEAHGFGMMASG